MDDVVFQPSLQPKQSGDNTNMMVMIHQIIK